MVVTLVDRPNDGTHQEDDVDDFTRVERTSQHVDEEQLEPSSHGDDARNNAIEHARHDDERHQQGQQGAFQLDVGELAVAEHQYDGRDAEQVEQVDADTQARHVADEDEPAVAVGLVGVVLPFQDEPEDDGRERRRVGVDLTFDGRKPERVAESVDQRAHQSRGFDGNELAQVHLTPVLQNQLSGEMGDAPEQKEDGGGA